MEPAFEIFPIEVTYVRRSRKSFSGFLKQVGGDIIAYKKTFLMIHALEAAGDDSKATLQKLKLSRFPKS